MTSSGNTAPVSDSLTALAPSRATLAPSEEASVRAYVTDQREELLRQLDEWLRIPSISAQPEHAIDVHRSAVWLAAAFRTAGCGEVELWQTPGLPAVYAQWRSEDPGAPVVLVYGHHDVQPAEPLDAWDSAPFSPIVDGDSVITDSGMLGSDSPSTVTSMRGVIAGELRLDGAQENLHSGVFGGALPNPATALTRLVAALHDAVGTVAVPGFYEGAEEPSALERRELGRVPFDERVFLDSTRGRALGGEAGWSTLERIGLRPTAEVNGMQAGYLGPGVQTVIPSSASAKLSFRLVAGQQSAAMRTAVERFVDARSVEGITATMTWQGSGVPAYRVNTATPAYRALASAIGQAFGGRPILRTRDGGSGPEATIADVIGRPLVFLGVGLPEDRIHAANEKVSISMLLKGAEAAAHLWRRFAAIGAEDLRRC